MNITPRQAFTWSTRTIVVAGPLALLLLLSWGMHWHILGARPQLMLMLYMLALTACTGAVCIAVLASCHAAIHKAFSAGYLAGSSLADVTDLDPEPAAPPRLQVVE